MSMIAVLFFIQNSFILILVEYFIYLIILLLFSYSIFG